MALREWVDVDFIKIASRHVSGNVVAIVAFRFTALVVNFFVEDQVLKGVIHQIENFTLVGLLLWLVYQLAVLVWSHRIRNGHGALVFIA